MALTSASLSTLRTELRARLGYAAVADTTGPMQALLNSFLIDAHEQLSIQIEASEDRRDWLLTLTASTALYELPTDADSRTPDHERILGVFVEVSGNWTCLRRGIDPELYSITTTGIPTHYDIAHGNAGTVPSGAAATAPLLEVWQPPSDAHSLRIRAYARPAAFAEDADTTTVDARLVMLLATANAKAHYLQPDAKQYFDQLQLRLRKMRARLHNDARYTREPGWTPPSTPKIVGIDD